MRILVGILSCHAYPERRQAQRETWLPLLTTDYRYFIGRPVEAGSESDVVYLDVPDDYDSLPIKVLAMIKWVYDQGYDFLMKCDDDTYVRPAELLVSGFENYDYVGCQFRTTHYHPYTFAAGGCGYWLSRRAMKAALDYVPYNGYRDTSEDREMGKVMYKMGIKAVHDPAYLGPDLVFSPDRIKNHISVFTDRIDHLYQIHNYLYPSSIIPEQFLPEPERQKLAPKPPRKLRQIMISGRIEFIPE